VNIDGYEIKVWIDGNPFMKLAGPTDKTIPLAGAELPGLSLPKCNPYPIYSFVKLHNCE